MRTPLFALLCLALALPLRPEAAGFYFREQEGWFWYEREPEPSPEPQPAPPPPQPAPPEPAPRSATTPEGPKPLSAQWLREHLGEYRDAAIDDPTPQNVALYLYLQRVALDKSSRFAAASQRAVQLDPSRRSPSGPPPPLPRTADRQIGDHRDQVLQRIARPRGAVLLPLRLPLLRGPGPAAAAARRPLWLRGAARLARRGAAAGRRVPQFREDQVRRRPSAGVHPGAVPRPTAGRDGAPGAGAPLALRSCRSA
jgi:hypothetical protein